MKLSTVINQLYRPEVSRNALRTALLLIPVLLIWLPTALLASEGTTVLDRIEKATESYDNNTIESVQPLNDETVLARERYQGGIFRVLARKKQIVRFRCSNCHNDKPVTVNAGAQLTHGDIQLNHGQPGSLSCIDCHHPEKRDFLEDKKGNTIDLDHSYQLCGQCHFRQKSDWIGGAHGKRAEYWAGERVVFNCTSCHNPHSPRFEKRFPATYSPASIERGSYDSPKK
jgi:hypothetical protein